MSSPRHIRGNFTILVLMFLLACGGRGVPTQIPQNVFVTIPPVTPPPKKQIGASTPRLLRQQVETLALANGDELSLDLALPANPALNEIKIPWVYVLVAPFPTVRDGVTSAELRAAWSGALFNSQPLLMAESTFWAFKAIWGEPASGSVQSVDEDQIPETAWNESAFAIIPFEELSPRWKVLTIDGQSPIRKGFDASRYPLVVSFSLQTSPTLQISGISFSNYEAAKLTTVVLTGTTALVRATAYRMEQKGITYPGEEVREILRAADITHISNEVAFFEACPSPDPNSKRLIFCSDPKYIGLLTDMGVDVVELTGNHFGDYGRVPMEATLAIYQANGIAHFGGGANLTDALQPALFEVNGNKIAFLGCNLPDMADPLRVAEADRAGVAPCDLDYFLARTAELSAAGYLVIFTFQWYEDYVPEPNSKQMADFRRLADAGAVIVSGSQAHFPKTMEFYNAAFIHYGLGNLFFDQMGNQDWMPEGIRREFIDRYVIYDGQLVGVELITTLLEDFARPRLMTEPERAKFLTEYFTASGWMPIVDVTFSGTSVP